MIKTQIRRCIHCQKFKALSKFTKAINKSAGYSYECVNCKLSERQKRSNRLIASNTKLINYIKQRPCADCGERLNPWQMDFDHRPNIQKSFSIALGKTYTSQRVMEEIAKCDLVCSNCHRNRTYLRLHPEFIPHSVTSVNLWPSQRTA